MLRNMGYRVGLYTSPHLSDVRERLRILQPLAHTARRQDNADFEGMIKPEELSGLTARLRPEIAAYNAHCPYGPLSFFEVYTAFAFQYFHDQAVDFVILETGLGGRLDATNVVQPHIVGITSISFDHTNKLGNTLTEIASEKAGIIKAGTDTGLVISAPQEDAARYVIRRRCQEQGCCLVEVGTDIRYQIKEVRGREQILDISGIFGSWKGLRLPFLGEHQLINAAVAVGLLAGALSDKPASELQAAIRQGLSQARWPGRFEIIGRRPAVIVDGAHNEASAAVLARTIEGFIPGEKIILILGISRDKDMANICRLLVPLAKKCIITQANNTRARAAADIARHIRQQGIAVEIMETTSVAAAIEKALAYSGPGDTIVVAGSLFVVGEARQILKAGRCRST